MTNSETKKSALQLMDGGPSKINPPNSHPSNPIHKASATPAAVAVAVATPVAATTPVALVSQSEHEVNKTSLIIGVVATVAILFIVLR